MAEHKGESRRCSHGPFDGTIAEAVYPVWKRMALSGVTVAAGEHNGLHTSVQLWQCHLCQYFPSQSCPCRK